MLRPHLAAVQVRGEPGGGQCPVAGDQVVQDGGVQGGPSGEPGGGGGVAGLDQQGGHLRPGLPLGFMSQARDTLGVQMALATLQSCYLLRERASAD